MLGAMASGNHAWEGIVHATESHDVKSRVAVLLLLAWVAWKLWQNSKPLTKRVTVANGISACPNPNCVRCQKYRQVQQSAKSRLPWVTRELQNEFRGESFHRLVDSIQNPRKYVTGTQMPSVLMVGGLSEQEIVTHQHKSIREVLDAAESEMPQAILEEVSAAPRDCWTINDTERGTWEILSVVNQGTWNQQAVQSCPRLCKLVRSIPNLMDRCLFGNAMVSKIFPGTSIEPHCGPANVRHRLQYTLHVPPSQCGGGEGAASASHLHLQVSDLDPICWSLPGDYFIFDDSFVHSVEYGANGVSYPATETNEFRMVLIVDLWPPSLSHAERSLIRFMYPSFSLPS